MNESEPTDVIQFGTSRFLQAHADLFFSEAAPSRSVTVVQSSGDSSRSSRLAALARPEGFSVKIQGMLDGNIIDEARRVTSIKHALSTVTNWNEVCQSAATAKFILSNTSEKGFEPRDEDLDNSPSQLMSYPAKLAHILAYRYSQGHTPPTLLPTELISNNGDHLKARILNIAQAAIPLAGFSDWLSAMPAANSIVDRIVSEPIEPAGAIAEPYALWAIENAPGIECPCNHPAVIMVQNIDEIAQLKLHILNLGHTYLAEHWLQNDQPKGVTVYDAMNTELKSKLLTLWTKEVLPGFANQGMEDKARGYITTTLERFSNPFLAHQLSDIAQNHTQKVHRRIDAFLQRYGSDAEKIAPTLVSIVKRNSV